MKRVGLVGEGLTYWGGGVDFLRTVADSLCICDPGLEVHVLLPLRGPRIAAQKALYETLSVARAVARGEAMKQIRSLGRSPLRRDYTREQELVREWTPAAHVHAIDSGVSAILSAARRLQLDALLPSMVPLNGSRVPPWVGYLFDFQHQHLPHFFSRKEIERRDRAFLALLSTAPAIVVNARAVAQDAAEFHPAAASRIVALPFSAAPRPEWLARRPEVAGSYGISTPYFMVCNQFWRHKDHGTAFEALAAIARRWPDVVLVCTGDKADWRDPSYFPTLVRRAQTLGVDKRLRLLGHIPKRDQIALLHDAVALIQPTLFEGGPGGGACYDAISLGVPAIVSDIAVNRELDEPGIRFFEAGNADSLATAMNQVLSDGRHPEPSEMSLVVAGRERRARCGRALVSAVRLAQETQVGRTT